MKKISVIVPIYKVEKYLNRCIESLVNQTYDNIEIILVDDGSPDNCPKICDEWARKDRRIKVIHKENGGLSDARNVGMKIATGDYLGFVDSDDVVSVNIYKVLIELLEKTNADMSICQYCEFKEDTEPVYTIDDKYCVYNDSNDVLKRLFSKKDVANAVWNKLYKKELFTNIEFPNDIRIGEDMYIMHRIILNSKRIAITYSRLYGYMVNRKDSIMNSCSINRINDLIKVSKSRFNDLKNNKEIIPYLNGSRAKLLYDIHVLVTESKDKEVFESKNLIDGYKLLKEIVNIRSFPTYLSGGNYRIKVLKIILLINRELFWKIRIRERK